MNYQTAAIAGGGAFLLSLLAGLLGGVPLVDLFLRALFWAALGFGGCLGIETLLRSLVPDLFLPPEAPAEPADEGPAPRPERVDITLEEEAPSRVSGFVEEVDTQERAAPRAAAPSPEPSAAGPEPESAPPTAAAAAPAAGPADDEEMPEIGSFLDSFKPQAVEGDGEAESQGASPEYADYAPGERSLAPAQEVSIDGEAQDPVILAKAVQTVMKRDA